MKTSQEIIEFCKNNNITVSQFYGKSKVGGFLYLSGLTSIPEGFNPTVGGSLDLSGLTSIPEGFNPTVGGSLDLRNLTSIPEGFNPTVGGYLDLNSLCLSLMISCNKLLSNYMFNWCDGKYIKVDGIFSEVIKKRGNVYHVKQIGKGTIKYLITDGTNFSHGDTLKQARNDLIYKVSNRDISKFKQLTINSILSLRECIECYRVITGACESGTKNFIETSLPKPEKEYSIKEIIDITKDQFGHKAFKFFFIKE